MSSRTCATCCTSPTLRFIDEEPVESDEGRLAAPTDAAVDDEPDAPWALLVRLLGPVEVVDGRAAPRPSNARRHWS